MASFDARTHSFGPTQAQYAPVAYANMGGPVHSNGMQHPPAGYRPYEEAQPQRQPVPNQSAQIYTAVYSSVAVYEMEVNGVAVMKRRSDSWLNATQILKVAGVEKGKRTKILEKEILTGQHEKVQGGYGRYQGTWINYQRGREFCRQYHVEELLRPLLDYDMGSDGTGPSGQVDTPTKEQAMAANRKRFYNTSMENNRMLNGQVSGNTFFQNISPTASNALAAMNKAARFESPLPRPGSAQRRPTGLPRQMSHQQLQSQESFPTGSQQSMQSFISDQDVNGLANLQYGMLGAPMYGKIESNTAEIQEPPRKRVKASSQDNYSQFDPSVHEAALVESQHSFAQHHYVEDALNGPQSLPPLFPPTDKAGEEKRQALMDLFTDPENSARTDFSTHSAIRLLMNEDLDIPLDISANTALHWAATLSRVSLMKLLISRGANIFRGNAAGQTALMAAVQVNNSFDHSCFPEMLELLGPLIELRDATGRTVLHHIAVSSSIKGRGISSRYYLESLLEFVVRQGSSSNNNSQQASFDGSFNKPKAIGLVKFMSDVVNVQDKSGNTALNLVARIGNRAIINQLDELGADYNIANNAGIRPIEFGIFPRTQGIIQHTTLNHSIPSSQVKPPSQIDLIREEIFATTQSILTQTESQYTTELTKSQALLDQQNAALRSIATQHKAEQDRLEALQTRAKERADRAHKILNLRRCVSEQQMRAQQRSSPSNSHHSNGNGNGSAASSQGGGDQDKLSALTTSSANTDAYKIDPNALPTSPSPSASNDAQRAYLSSLPAASILRARLAAYTANNAALEAKLTALKGRSSELEAQYRKVVALCAGVEEARVDGLLEGLVAAVESEDVGGGGVVEVGRVREFLRKVEGVET